MQIYRLTAGLDGRVTLPNTRPGQTVTVQVEPVPEEVEPEPLTLATAKTPEERAQVIAAIEENARKLRDLFRDAPVFTAEDLYGEDGLPK